MGPYFGTDGIRGVAGELLTAEFAVQVGRAAAVVLAQKAGPHPLFVIGRDTRLSGPMLEAGLVAGLTSGGARVEIAGVIPTPGLATLVHQRGAEAGVVIKIPEDAQLDAGGLRNPRANPVDVLRRVAVRKRAGQVGQRAALDRGGECDGGLLHGSCGHCCPDVTER